MQLSANQVGGTYQWVDCSNANSLIPGAVGKVFTPKLNGSYAVLLNIGGCFYTSLCQSIAVKTTYSSYPNPSNGLFDVDLTAEARIKVVNKGGKEILNILKNAGDRRINIQNQPSGIYFIKIISMGKEQTITIYKN